MSTKHLKRLSIAAGLVVFSLLISFWQWKKPKHPEAQPEPRTETVIREVSSSSPVQRRFDLTRPPALSDPFYRTIIDNNLFRPLGWTPPRPQEPYRLTGTLIPRDANTAPKAFLLANATNTTHIVTLGDTLGKDTTVTAIESKQVTLQTSGQLRTLRLNTALWLNTSHTNRASVRKQTPAGLPIRVGNARLKNPEKWGLHRR